MARPSLMQVSSHRNSVETGADDAVLMHASMPTPISPTSPPTSPRNGFAMHRSPACATPNAASTALCNLAMLPGKVLFAIASHNALPDYLALSRLNRLTWSTCRAHSNGTRQLLRDLSAVQDAASIGDALARIGTHPSAWQASMLRTLARATSALDIRDMTRLGPLWRIRIDDAFAWQQSCPPGLARGIGLRDLLITALCKPDAPSTPRVAHRLADATLMHALYSISLDSWPPVLEQHRDAFPAGDSLLTHFATLYPGGAHRFSHALTVDVMHWLYDIPQVFDVSAHLACRFGIALADQRLRLDAIMAETIVGKNLESYASLMTHCQRWRPGDGVFRTRVERCLVKAQAAYVLLNRHRPFPHTTSAIDSDEIRPHIRQFILESEQDTVTALANEPEAVAFFLSLCEWIGAPEDSEDWWSMLAVAEGAPLPMQAVLLHRLANSLVDIDGDEAFVVEAVRRLCDRGYQIQHHAVSMESPALLARVTAGLIDAYAALMKYDFVAAEHGIGTLLEEHEISLPPKYWAPMLKAASGLLNVERPTPDDIAMTRVVSRKALASYANDYLRDPEATGHEMHEDVFAIIAPQIATLWDVLPDAPDLPSQRFAAVAMRLGLSERQSDKLHDYLLNDQVERIVMGEVKLNEAWLRLGLESDLEKRGIEDRLWATMLLPRLTHCRKTPHRIGSMIEASEYLKMKTHIFYSVMLGTEEAPKDTMLPLPTLH